MPTNPTFLVYLTLQPPRQEVIKSKQRKHEYLFGNASLLFLRAGPPLMGLVLTSFEIIHNNASNTDFCSINQGAVNTFNTLTHSHTLTRTLSLSLTHTTHKQTHTY